MAPSKSKETKKSVDNTNTKRRNPPKKSAAANAALEGHPPADFVEQMAKTAKNRQQIYDLLKPQAAYSSDVFFRHVKIGNAAEVVHPAPFNIRLPVPYSDRRRVKVYNDEEYFSGEYTRLETSEYMIAQAPTKDNARVLWKAIQTDQTRVLVSLVTEAELTTSDDVSKCFQFWPTEVGQTMEFEQPAPHEKIVVTCKGKEGTSYDACKYVLEYTGVTDPPKEKDGEHKKQEKQQEEPTDQMSAPVPKTHTMTLFHMKNWTGLRPTNGDHPLEVAVNLTLLLQDVNKAEMEVIRKAMENYLPPVLIQSMDGIGRGAITWVILMLLKDVEKKECFDVPDLIRKIQKIRPGSLSNYYQFTLCFVIACHIGKNIDWCPKECTTALEDITAKFPLRKVNEHGNLA